jgi:ketosteroid isomerase-like protein
MSEANVTLVRDLYAAFGRGDIDALMAGLSADVHWEVVGRREDYPLLGVRKGHQGAREFFQQLSEIQEAVEFAPREFLDAGDTVVVLGREKWKIRKTGKPAESEWAHFFTVRNGKVTMFREFCDTAQFALAYR